MPFINLVNAKATPHHLYPAGETIGIIPGGGVLSGSATYVIDNTTTTYDRPGITVPNGLGEDTHHHLDVYLGTDDTKDPNDPAKTGHLEVVIDAGLTQKVSLLANASYYNHDDPNQFSLVIPTGWTYSIVTASNYVYGVATLAQASYRIYNPAGVQMAYVNFYAFNQPVGGGQNVTIGSGGTPCFTEGAQILCENGRRVSVEDLRPGDKVMTKDNGPQELRSVLSTVVDRDTLQQFPQRLPVRIKAGTFGNHDDCLVSAQHRFLIASTSAELMFGENEVLVPAKHLIDGDSVRVEANVESITYYHLVFNQHELVNSDGLWSEAYQPGQTTMQGMSTATREELMDLFPGLDSVDAAAPFEAARMSLNARQFKMLNIPEQAY